jgi:hypothetical protein
MPRIRPLTKALELATYAGERPVSFRLLGRGELDATTPEVLVPISIAWRLYYLARAFDCQTVKYIDPRGGASQLDYVGLQLLISEFEFVAQVTSDPVSRHYLGMLLPLLTSAREHTGSRLHVVAP